jgi:acetylornithine/succinyldiaminopimelate/putrescine aminotransferase
VGSVCINEGDGVIGALSLESIQVMNDPADDLKAKPTHQNIIRLAPPLVITEAEIQKALAIIDRAMKELPSS